jgi:hypothetical protein
MRQQFAIGGILWSEAKKCKNDEAGLLPSGDQHFADTK